MIPPLSGNDNHPRFPPLASVGTKTGSLVAVIVVTEGVKPFVVPIFTIAHHHFTFELAEDALGDIEFGDDVEVVIGGYPFRRPPC